MIKIRRYLSLVIYFGLAVPLSAQLIDSLQVLFIGNSYTHRNSLPQLFAELSQSAGKSVIAERSTYSSGLLETHSVDDSTLSAISRGIWDFIILQEQSQIPTIEHFRYNSMYPSARFLDSLITGQSAKTVFYMTWGRKYGGQQARRGYYSPNFINFFHMQDSLQSAYEEIANELSAIVAPVGVAWANALKIDPSADLWTHDHSHPTIQGSYLAACVFYSTLFNESPVGLSYTGGLTSEDAAFFQNVAYQTVTSIEIDETDIASTFSLFQNFPNPFNPITKINYSLSQSGYTRLIVYNSLGEILEILVDEFKNAGMNNEVIFDGSKISSGIYFYSIRQGDLVQTRKMLLLK